MVSKKSNNMNVERITEIYVAVFPVQFSDTEKAEMILAGYKKDPSNSGNARVRATLETRIEAVADMVAMCDEIVAQQEEIKSYRLLKFDKDGIHELDPADFQKIDRLSSRRYRASLWGSC
jgi:hypothetical protein